MHRIHRYIPANRSLNGVLLAFTLIAIAGFGVFGLHPETLSWLVPFPRLLSFYGLSFQFFAQAHIILSSLVLAAILTRSSGWKWVPALATVYALSLTSELLGTVTGWPFGPYHYTELLGDKWFGHVPFLIPVSWFTIALPAYVLAARATEPRQVGARVVLGAALLTAWDLALDPAMSFLTSYWLWETPGPYYGMPLVNLAGWFVTGVVLMGAMERLGVSRWSASLSPRAMRTYYLIVVGLPLGLVAVAGLWPAVIATCLAVAALLAATTARQDAKRIRRKRPQGSGEDLASLTSEDLPDFFRRNSRSFSFAARWFEPSLRTSVGKLYAFCRVTDDIVDGSTTLPLIERRRRLDAWEQIVRTAYSLARASRQRTGFDDASNSPERDGRADRSAIPPWLVDLMRESAVRRVPQGLLDDFFDGVRADLAPVRMNTWNDLSEYSYRVASVVGVWLCYLAGVRDTGLLAKAESLGQAMQFTNVLRDVGEDLDTGRVYIPADLLTEYDLDIPALRQMKSSGERPEAYRRLIEEMMRRADAEYEQAWQAIPLLPATVGRPVAVAAAVYRAVQDEVRRNDYDNLNRRAVTSSITKARWAVTALLRRRRAAATLKRVASDPTDRRIVEVEPEARAVGEGDGAAETRRRPAPHALPAALLAALLGTGSLSAGQASAQAPAWHYVTIPGSVSAAGDRIEIPMAAEIRPEPVEILRRLYFESVRDEHSIDRGLQLVDRLRRTQSLTPLAEAYAAALVVMRAKHARWPPRKMRNLNEGLPVLDRLVVSHPDHVEIRYLRLISCYYLPRFLGRKGTVREDFAALAVYLPGARDDFPSALFQDMVRFVLAHADLTESGERALSKILDDQSSAERP